MKYKNIEDAEAIIKAIELVYKKPLNREEFTVENIADKFNQAYKYLHASDEYFERKDIRFYFNEKDFSKLLFKWAFFSDIAIQTSVEEAFGCIIGVRDTKSWAGNRYFLWRPHDESIIDIANSSPKIYEINMDFPKKTTDFQKRVFSYYNAHCYYKVNGISKKGKIHSVGIDSVDIEDADGNMDTIIESEIDNSIIELSDQVGDLNFAITVTSN